MEIILQTGKYSIFLFFNYKFTNVIAMRVLLESVRKIYENKTLNNMFVCSLLNARLINEYLRTTFYY